jgi:membrane protease YdiL (CAAX protease family)
MRNDLVWETRFVVFAFVFPGVVAAVTVLVRHFEGGSDVDRFFNVLPGDPLGNMILGIINYLAIAVVVPIALLLLARTGQPPSTIGLGVPRLGEDIWPGIGLAAASYGTNLLLLVPFAPLLAGNTKLVNPPSTVHVPGYYVVYGLFIAATTAISEEVIVNGYLLTRLEQFGWPARRALVLSLAVRTSYHIYYGLGFLLTVPFGYYVTRSFQKHRRLNRPIAAHFIYDAVLITIAVLSS